jgi:hypothetical protein
VLKENIEHEIQFKTKHLAGLREALARADSDDLAWLIDALNTRRFFMRTLFSWQLEPPEQMFESLIRAAVAERNPSLGQYFIEPCVQIAGFRRVIRRLLDIFKSGSDEEKIGVAHASYWVTVEPPWGPPPSAAPDQFEPVVVSTVDLLAEQQHLFLTEFLANSNLRLQRALICHVHLQPAECLPEHGSLAERVLGGKDPLGSIHPGPRAGQS